MKDLCRVFSCCALLALAGCATRAAPPAAPPGASALEARDARLASLDRFAVSGGFGYWDNQQNLSAAIDWQQDGQALRVSLRAPLGLGRLLIEQDDGGASVLRSGREPLRGPTAGPLLREAIGLSAPVPLEQLGNWIRGLPGPTATAVTRDASGRLSTLAYRDATGQRWFARVRRYRQVDGWWLPALLTAVSGERHMKLALSEWRLPPDVPPQDDRPVPAAPGPVADPRAPPEAVPEGGGGRTPLPAGRRLPLPGA